jgi:transposase
LEKSFTIDEIAKKYGHAIFGFPPYHCIFNPIERAWSQLLLL